MSNRSRKKGKRKETFPAVAKERLEDVRTLLKRAVAEKAIAPDDVHDLRVETRRLSEAAALMKGLIEEPRATAVGEALRGLRHATGELRDLDVLDEHLRKWRRQAEVKRVALRLVERGREERPKLEERLREAATSSGVTRTMVTLARVLDEDAGSAEEKLEQALEARLKKRRKRLKKAFGTAAKEQTPTALHEARIAAKKLRYVLELAKAFDGEGRKREVKALKEIQSLLGDHHDTQVILEAMEPGLKDVPVKEAKRWRERVKGEQAEQAAEFFARSYAWMNELVM